MLQLARMKRRGKTAFARRQATRNIRAPAAAVTLPPKPALPVQAQPILASPVGSTAPRLLRERLAALADEILRSEGATINRHSPTS